MTGIAGGGYAVLVEAGSRQAQVLDFFVAVPGLGQPRATPVLEELAVPFGEELVHYYVGAATCAVPGVPAGLDELWRRAGTLPWERLVEPALRLARAGLAMPPAHAKCLAMLAPVMTMREGGQIYSPGGRLLEAGDRLDQPGLVAALEVGRRGRQHVLRGHARRVAAEAHGRARRPRHPGGPGRLPGRVGRACRGRLWVSESRRAVGSRSSPTR